MNEPSPIPARPVSVVTIFFILALLGIFLFVARRYYVPASVAPQNAAAENLGEDAAWRATHSSRRSALHELREKEATKAVSYGWADQKAGVVQLPIERAMELTAEKYGAKK